MTNSISPLSSRPCQGGRDACHLSTMKEWGAAQTIKKTLTMALQKILGLLPGFVCVRVTFKHSPPAPPSACKIHLSLWEKSSSCPPPSPEATSLFIWMVQDRRSSVSLFQVLHVQNLHMDNQGCQARILLQKVLHVSHHIVSA